MKCRLNQGSLVSLFVAAALGVSAVLLSREEDFSYTLEIAGWIFSVHVSVLLVLVAMLGVYAVRTLDLGVYHKMLRGAVTFGEDLEENYIKGNFFELEMGMTQAISHFSRHSDASKTKSETGKFQYSGGNEKSALDKIGMFYNVVLIFLFLSAVILFVLSAKLHQQDSVALETGNVIPIVQAPDIEPREK